MYYNGFRVLAFSRHGFPLRLDAKAPVFDCDCDTAINAALDFQPKTNHPPLAHQTDLSRAAKQKREALNLICRGWWFDRLRVQALLLIRRKGRLTRLLSLKSVSFCVR